MRDAVTFTRMTPADLATIERQPSQRVLMGAPQEYDAASAAALAAQPEAWTARRGDRLLACMGICETFPGASGTAWALLAPGIGAAHLAISRFARARIAGSGLARVEAIAPAADAEAILQRFPGLDAMQLLVAVLARPTRECCWPVLLGLNPAHVLRKFGAARETYVLFERVAA